MPKTVVADIIPIQVSLQTDQYYFYCTCGLSKQQPYCDGAHRGTGTRPLPFMVKEAGDYLLCQCKLTADAPYCDGSHKHCKDK